MIFVPTYITCQIIELSYSQLDESNERQSAALACRRFKGAHSFDRIASTLDTIHAEFVDKASIVRTITDNASNFVKAFSQFQFQVHFLNFQVDYSGLFKVKTLC